MMLGSIQPGDCVWDVGANVGFYTEKFSELVGAEGKIYAFEPSPINFTRLKEVVGSLANTVILPMALGADKATVAIQQGDDPIGATSKIVTGSTENPIGGEFEVELVRGDKLVSSGQASSPNVIKVDTEGFELDVLKGLGDILISVVLRTICIEVHFKLLQERGLSDAPSHIERILEAAGFSYSWPDASHIIANRI